MSIHKYDAPWGRRNSTSRGEEIPFRPSREINHHLKHLAKLDNHHGPLAVILDYATIGIAVIFSLLSYQYLPFALSIIVYLLAAVVIGSAQRGLATLLHEASHKTCTKNGALNFLIGSVCSGWPIFQLYFVYYASHILGHHRQFGDRVNDPDIANYEKQGLDKQQLSWFSLRNTFAMLVGFKALVQLPYIMRHRLVGKPFLQKSHGERTELIFFLIFWTTLLSFLIAQGWIFGFLIFWIVPYFTSFQAIGWLIETAEHYPIVFAERRAVLRTRNRLGNRFERFLTGRHGEWAHLVHHLRPGLPFWVMEQAHETLMQDDEYRLSSARYSGLFTKACQPAPTILQAIPDEIGKLRNLKTK